MRPFQESPLKINGFYVVLASLMLSAFSVFIFNIDANLQFKRLDSAWNITHFAINYFEFGFVKRGLFGSLYYCLGGEFDSASLLAVQYSFILLFVFFSYQYFKLLNLNNSFVFLLFMLSPATVMQYGADLGRFDALLVVVFLLASRCGYSPPLFFMFSSIGILLHEIYVFSLLPASYLIAYHSDCDDRNPSAIIVTLLKNPVVYALLTVIILVLLYGRYEGGLQSLLHTFNKSLDQNWLLAQLYYPKSSVYVWIRSIEENLRFTSVRFSMDLENLYFIGLMLALALFFYLMGVDFRKSRYYLIVLCALPMFALGTDWGRWYAFIFIALFVSYISTETNKARAFEKKRMLIFSAYGPFGIGGFLSPLQSIVLAIVAVLFA